MPWPTKADIEEKERLEKYAEEHPDFINASIAAIDEMFLQEALAKGQPGQKLQEMISLCASYFGGGCTPETFLDRVDQSSIRWTTGDTGSKGRIKLPHFDIEISKDPDNMVSQISNTRRLATTATFRSSDDTNSHRHPAAGPAISQAEGIFTFSRADTGALTFTCQVGEQAWGEQYYPDGKSTVLLSIRGQWFPHNTPRILIGPFNTSSKA